MGVGRLLVAGVVEMPYLAPFKSASPGLANGVDYISFRRFGQPTCHHPKLNSAHYTPNPQLWGLFTFHHTKLSKTLDR
jgi:hypothetical protein